MTVDESMRQVDFLERKIATINGILVGLEDNPAYKQLMELYEGDIKVADSQWQVVPPNDEKFEELRIRKLAASHIVNRLDMLKQEVARDNEALERMLHPEQYQRNYNDQY